jgi:signal transduction histidine kinase
MFSSIPLMPHAVCWRADPHLIWVMVIANGITALSYLCICFTLFYLARRTRAAIANEWGFFVVGFALFIVACGSTHLMEVVTTWIPWFWLDASANILTAILSAWVAAMLIRRVNAIGFSISDYAARLRHTEKEKRQMLDSLLSAQKLEDWSRMSTVVAHEIANPLEAIQNLLYLIRSAEGVSDEIVQFAQVAAEETDRVLTISRSTLSFFRQGTAPESIDLFSAAQGVHFLLDTVLHTREIELDFQATGDTTVDALPGEPRQVMLNLVRNAYEATTLPGSRVMVKLVGQPDGVEILVTDQGSGMDPEVLKTLFKFGMTTKGENGNGMGLWAVQQILLRHGGHISVQSELGKGTSFTLWWPRRYAPAPRSDRVAIPRRAASPACEKLPPAPRSWQRLRPEPRPPA